MDVTAEVMLPARGAVDFSTSAHPKWRVLALITVYVPMKTLAVVGMPRTGYVHVTGVPTPAGWEGLSDEAIQSRICRRLTRPYVENDSSDPLATLLEKRLWVGDASLIPAGARTTLRTERQITVTWTAFKNVMRRRDTNAALTDNDLI